MTKQSWYREKDCIRINRKRTVLLLLLLGTCIFFGKKLAAGRRNLMFAAKLGSGINIGNSLDATGVKEYHPDAEEGEYETAWGNPPITPLLFQRVKKAGFSTVRIPVTWEEHLDEQGRISKAWMDRVQEVVDQALEEDLYVILNTHHEEWMNLEKEKEEWIEERFAFVWMQIAERFGEYEERLLFEGMNEPRLRNSKEEWGAGTSQLQEMVNRLNQVFVDTVRRSGKENRNRYLLICPYGSSSQEKAMEALKIPDRRVMISVHMYEPYWFCQDEEGSGQWSAVSEKEKGQIEEAFQNMDRLFRRKGIPVLLTEFGCQEKGSTESREQWIAFYHRMAEKYGVGCIWWDNGSNYQLINRENGQIRYPSLVRELVRP